MIQKPYITAGLGMHAGNWRGSLKLRHHHSPMPANFFEKGDKALEPSVSDLKGPSDTQQTNKSLASYNFKSCMK